MELMTEEKKDFQRTEIGLIPSEWSFEEIGPKIDLLSGNPFSSSGYSDHGIRLLRGANIKRGNTQWDDDNTKFWPENEPSLKKYKLKPDDLVIAMDGSLVGRSYAFLSEQDVPSFLLQRVARIRSDKIDTKYLKYFIGSSWFVDYCDSVKTNTAIPHISSTDIKNFKIPLPPTLAEQQAIATALSDVDELIRSLDGLIQKKQAIKKGAMQQLLTGKKRLLGFDGEWMVKNFGDLVIRSELGGNYSNSESTSPYPLIKMGNLGRGKINLDKKYYIKEGSSVNEIHKLKHGDLLFNTRNTPQLVGKVAIWRNELSEAYYNSNLMKLEFDDNFVASNFFMNYLLNTDHFIEKLKSVATGTTSVAAIYTRDLFSLEVSIPKEEEQKAIAQILSDMDRELQTLRQKREKYVQVKQGMMHELLTGKTRLV